MKSNLKCKLVAAAAFMVAGVCGAGAEEAVKLRVAHPFSTSHYFWNEGIKPFLDAVSAATQGSVSFDVYPANQLGKDGYGVLSSGLTDMVLIVTSYDSVKFPLSSVSELPGMSNTSCEASDRFWALAREGGALDKYEYKDLGLHALFASNVPPYNLVTISRKINTLDDVKGLKIYSSGAGVSGGLTALGAVPLRMTSTELYDAATRGTIDGSAVTYSSLVAYGADKVSKHTVRNIALGSSGLLMAVRQDVWDRLPENVRGAMAAAARETQQRLCEFMDRDNNEKLAAMQAQGTSITMLPDEELAKWNARLAASVDEWKAVMNANNKPGTEVLEAYRAAGASN